MGVVGSPGGDAERNDAELEAALDVLIAEDNDDSRDCLADAVVALGHTCRTARDGAEAWELYKAYGADVILSDWNMPSMTGLELCEKVRDVAADQRHTCFVFITANDPKDHQIRAMDAGADDYLCKPIDLEDLQARLASAQRTLSDERRVTEVALSAPAGRVLKETE